MIGPNTAAELRTWLAQPRTDPELPTIERIDTLIARLSLGTAERRVSDAEAKERLNLYWRVLRSIPLIDLARAFDQLLATSTFMPKPAEVRQAAEKFGALRRYRESRARHLVWKHENEWTPPVTDPVTVEDLAALKAQTAEAFPSQRSEA